jgi:hypothetical protein
MVSSKEDFLLKEYEQTAAAYHSSTDRRYSLLKLYLIIVALPTSIFSIIANFIYNNIISLEYGQLFSTLFLFIMVLSGFLIFNSLISVHITKVIYAKTINKIRGYYVENDSTNTLQKFIILPITDDKPPFFRYGSLFYDCMLISMINSIICGVSTYILLNYYWTIFMFYPIILFILIFFLHFATYYYRLKKQDRLWTKKRNIFA